MIEKLVFDIEELKKTFRIKDGKLERINKRGIVQKWKAVASKTNQSNGYCQVGFNGRLYMHHVILWTLYYNENIPEGLVIDHINGNRIDNRIENLIVINASEHIRLHKTKLPKTKICIVCGKEFEPPINHRGRNIICSKECCEKHHNQTIKNNCKKINQYSKNGELIKVWNSLHEIEKNLGLPATNVCKCCKGKLKSIGGFIWKYN